MSSDASNNGGLLSHLDALRKMILEILVIFVVLFFLAWFWSPDVLAFLQAAAGKIADQRGLNGFELRYFSLMEPFMVELKTAMVMALAMGMPFYFHRIWVFLAPALYANEKPVLIWGALAAWVLFCGGAALGIFGVTPLLVDFSLNFARDGLTPVIGLGNFIGLLLGLALAFGVMFELPLLLLILAVCNIISLDTLRRQRPVVAVVVLVLAAILTPPDVISQLMLAVPSYLLFELTLLIGKFLVRTPEKAEEPETEFTDNPESSVDSAGGDEESLQYYERLARRDQRRKRMPSLRSKRLRR